VLVTGASGFIGRHLTPMLESNGWIVRQALRTPPARPGDVFIPSIGSNTDWRDALAGVDAVVHLAAQVHHTEQSQRADSYEDTNVEGTLNLARNAGSIGVSRFVFISTVLVHGRSSDGLRPYNESDDLNFRLLMWAVGRGVPLPLAAIRNRRAFVSVQNLASFILARLLHAERNFDVFLVADHEQVSTPEFIRRLAKAAGMRARLFPMPAPLLDTLLRFSGRPEARESLMGSLKLDLSKATATGWSPPISLDEGLRLATSEFAADGNRQA
jgi:UDP-glucose 4-epimerase